MPVSRSRRWVGQSAIGVVAVVAVGLALDARPAPEPQGAQPTGTACAVNNGGCPTGVACSDNPAGGWRCGENCPPGFSGTPATGCVDINECAISNGQCDPLTRCRNVPGSRTCGACPADHKGDGYLGCFDVNELTAGMDTKGPAVTVPGSMTLLATSPAGTTMAFSVKAVDFADGERPVSCTPASGSTFPIGTTKVSCSSVDTKGNRKTATFSVTVIARDAP